MCISFFSTQAAKLLPATSFSFRLSLILLSTKLKSMRQCNLLFVLLLVGLSLVSSEGFALVSPKSRMTNPLRIRGGGSPSAASVAPFVDTIPNTPLFSTSPIPAESKCPVSKSMAIFGSVWGTGGVIYILAKAIKRVLPIALEPLKKDATMILTPVQWGAYALTCVFFAYYEGYKGFQTKFAPLVVKRSCSLVIGTPQGTVLNYLLAPIYSMGLKTATKKRLITSWCVTIGVAGIVAAVKRLPTPWRNIVDAGVVVGLSWGAISIMILYVKAWMTGKPPDVDACLPEFKKETKKE